MRPSLPRPLLRREILYGTGTSKERLVQLAAAYLDKGLLFDAVDFYAQARDREGLGRMRERAMRDGDAFLLRRVQEAAPDLVEAADWGVLEGRARSLGKEVYAERAAGGGAPPPPPLQEEMKASETGEETGEETGQEPDE